MTSGIRSIIVAMAIGSLATASQAAPIKWTLTDINLNDGGLLTGSFIYDEDIHQLSQIHIFNTAGSVGTAGSFDQYCSGPWCPADNQGGLTFTNKPTSEDMRGVKVLIMVPDGVLTNAGGTFPITSGAVGTCNTEDCDGASPDIQVISSGSIVGTPYLLPQNIIFTSLAPLSPKVGGAYDIAATGGESGEPVTFSIDPTASETCSITGNTVRFIAEGTCTINANQAGSSSHERAVQTALSFSVSAAAVVPAAAATPVPTLGQWGLALLSLVLGGIALIRQRHSS